jgi:hypothetical protein
LEYLFDNLAVYIDLDEQDGAAVELNSLSEDTRLRAIIFQFTGGKLQDKIQSGLKAFIELAEIPVISVFRGKSNQSDLEVISASHICYANRQSAFETADEIVGYEEAVLRGMINGHTHDGARDAALESASAIVKMAPLAVKSCIASVKNSIELPLADGLKEEIRLFGELFASNDMRRGTAAFLIKEKPDFKGD